MAEDAPIWLECFKNNVSEARYYEYEGSIFCLICGNTTAAGTEVFAFSCGHSICYACADLFIASEIGSIAFGRMTPDQAFDYQGNLIEYVMSFSIFQRVFCANSCLGLSVVRVGV